MKERLLDLALGEAVEAFSGLKWKFFEVGPEDSGVVRIEVPRGSGESYVVEVRYANPNQKRAILAELVGAGFIQQTIRITSNW